MIDYKNLNWQLLPPADGQNKNNHLTKSIITSLLNNGYYLAYDRNSKTNYIFNGYFWQVVENDEIRLMLEYITDHNASKNGVKEVIDAFNRYLMSEYPARPDLNYLYFQDGYIINWHSNEVKPVDVSTRPIFTPYALNISYEKGNGTGNAEEINNYFDSITKGDTELQQTLYQLIGDCIAPCVDLATFFLITGGGGNGKSTFLKLITAIAGAGNTSSVTMQGLGERFNGDQIMNKLANIADDMDKKEVLNSGSFKNLVSGTGFIEFERKGIQEKIRYINSTTCFLYACNEMPLITDTSDGMKRRSVVIEFNNQFATDKDTGDTHFLDKFATDGNKLLILYKALAEFNKALANRTISKPASVQDATASFWAMNNPYLQWASEIELDQRLARDGYIVNEDALEDYRQWAERNGYNKNISTKTLLNKIAATYHLASEQRRVSTSQGNIKKRVWYVKK